MGCITELKANPDNYDVQLTDEPNGFSNKTFYININDILSRDNCIAQKAINTIFKQLKGQEEVFVRLGSTPVAYYQEDYEGVYLRHTDLNRAPNISEKEILEFDDIVRSEARKVSRKFNRLATQAGFEYDDLYNIGLVYLVSFLHEHRRESKLETRKILRVCLRQRYNHWAKTTLKKHKNAMSSGMYISEIDYERFRTEVKFQHSIKTEENEISIPEYENKKFKVSLNGHNSILEIKVKKNQPSFFIAGQELRRDQLVDLMQKEQLKLR
jgi:hypothetical protein